MTPLLMHFVCLSVCLSVCHTRGHVKRFKIRTYILLPYDTAIIQVSVAKIYGCEFTDLPRTRASRIQNRNFCQYAIITGKQYEIRRQSLQETNRKSHMGV